jgi:predicted permease
MKLLRRLHYLMHQKRMERELEEELEFHVQMSGHPQEVGNLTQAREAARAVWIWPWLQSVWQDIAYAVRNLRRHPGFALMSLAALGFAIGINTSLFTLYNAVAIRAWPVKDPSRMVKIYSYNPQDPAHSIAGIGPAESRYLAAQSRVFSGIGFLREEPVYFGFEPFGKPTHAALVSGDYFHVLELGMHLGRGFLPGEDQPKAPEAVAVLSFPLWRDHFGSDRETVGKQVELDGVPFTIVGVTPEEFTGVSSGGNRQDVYLPSSALILLHPTEAWPSVVLSSPDYCCEFVFGRLAQGKSRPQAAAELEVLDRQFNSQRGKPARRFALTSTAILDTPPSGAKHQIGATFLLMFTAAMLVVLLACANVGNLLIARSSARRKEIEIRRSIGAGRGRIIRQLLTESFLLAFCATGLGLAIAYKLPRLLIEHAFKLEPPGVPIRPDETVLAYAITLAVFACIAFGLAPAIHGTKSGAVRGFRLRNLLLGAQVTLSVVLLVGAALMLRGVDELRIRDAGFAIDGVSVVSFELPARSMDGPHNLAFYRGLTAAAPSLGNGSARLGMTEHVPFGTSFSQTDIRLPGTPETARVFVDYQEVTGGYFDVLRIPILAGRNFEPVDRGKNVVMVNETLAHRLWNGENPLGKSIISRQRTREVIGLVKDVHAGGLDEYEPVLYSPFSAFMIPKILVDSHDTATIESIHTAVTTLDSRGRMQTISLRDNLDQWLKGPRLGAEIAGALGLFALTLAVVGLSGVFAYVVQHRTKEIGIRMALGAKPAQVIGLVLGSSSRALLIGLLAGFAIALPGTRLLRSFLYGVSPVDPAAYIFVALILAAAGTAAAYSPARRAAHIDPLNALRHDD